MKHILEDVKKNKHNNKKQRKGRGSVGKTPVIGLKSREGKVKAYVSSKTDTHTLTSTIRKNVNAGSSVYTDQFGAYKGLKEFLHKRVNHGNGEYVREQVHTNGIESFWATLKRGYYGIYHHWSIKHLQRYINEFTTRFNLRDETPLNRIQSVITGSYNKHLSYKELINA